jgi:hypothetical protein
MNAAQQIHINQELKRLRESNAAMLAVLKTLTKEFAEIGSVSIGSMVKACSALARIEKGTE